MSAKRKLKNALSAIEDAVSALKRAQARAPNEDDIRRALRDLEDAESDIKRASKLVEED